MKHLKRCNEGFEENEKLLKIKQMIKLLKIISKIVLLNFMIEWEKVKRVYCRRFQIVHITQLKCQ
jgi:hypothetical protein